MTATIAPPGRESRATFSQRDRKRQSKILPAAICRSGCSRDRRTSSRGGFHASVARFQYAAAMDFKSQLTALQGKMLTIYIIGSNEEFAGTLLNVGNDFVTLEAQPDDAPHTAQSLIAIHAISCVTYRT